MNDRPSWMPPRPADEVQLVLPLPPVPRIKRDMCRYCHALHFTSAEFLICREANT